MGMTLPSRDCGSELFTKPARALVSVMCQVVSFFSRTFLLPRRESSGSEVLTATRSSWPALRARTPTCAQAERWSPCSSNIHRRDSASGRTGGRWSLRRSMTPYSASGTRVSALVERAVKAQLAASPACDSSNARDVGSMSLQGTSGVQDLQRCW